MNFEVVKRVRDAVSVPLVLHGASGISDTDIKTAISLGIAKINIHTELCQAAMVAVKENQDQPFLHLEREVRKAVKNGHWKKLNCSVLMAKRNNDMDNLDVICIGAAIVDIPLQPVSKNIFDVDSYPLERIAMTTGVMQ